MDNIIGREHKANYDAITEMCIMHLEIEIVGPTAELCWKREEKEEWNTRKNQRSFRVNSRALAAREGNGSVKFLIKRQGSLWWCILLEFMMRILLRSVHIRLRMGHGSGS